MANEPLLFKSEGLMSEEQGRRLSETLSRSPYLLFLIYLISYAILDWEGLSHPSDMPNVSPWAPSSGLTYALILVFGWRYLWLSFVGDLLAHIVFRPLLIPLHIEVLSCLVVGLGHGLCALVLLHPKLEFSPKLITLRDVILLALVASVGALVIGTLDLLLMTLTDQVAWHEFRALLVRSWTGDVIGVLVMAPFLIFVLTARPRLTFSLAFLAQCLTIFGSLWLIFHWGIQYFYILFLPIVWMAVRGGLTSVTVGLVLIQFGFIMAIHQSGSLQGDVSGIEARLLVLTLTGFVAGALESERRRAEFQFRQQQSYFAHRSRIDSISGLAGALAHEINQPLTAAGTYARIVTATLGSDEKAPGTRSEAALKTVAQIERAVAVVNNLRNLMRSGHLDTRPAAVLTLVKKAIAAMHAELEGIDIDLKIMVSPQLPLVRVDELSVQQVFVNLVRNSVKSLTGAGTHKGTVTISAHLQKPDFIEITVHDTGPGFSPEMTIDELPAPFISAKADGLGVGLLLCRSIVEGQGGQFWIGEKGQGAVVCFTLPTHSEPIEK